MRVECDHPVGGAAGRLVWTLRDNPFFMQKLAETFAANADVMGYEAYFEDGNLETCSKLTGDGAGPNAAAHYQALYRVR